MHFNLYYSEKKIFKVSCKYKTWTNLTALKILSSF